MIEGKQLDNLIYHAANITSSLIGQISTDGAVLTRFGREIRADIESAHHITELLYRIDPNMFHHYLQLLLSWMVAPQSGVSDRQFTLDTLSQLIPESEPVQTAIQQSILPTQLDRGGFTRYTAYLHGGDFFSTLWCIKILQNMGEASYQGQIRKAFEYLAANVEDSGIQMSQIGFLYLLLNRSVVYKNDALRGELRQRILQYLSTTSLSPETLLTFLYLCEDLVSDPGDEEGLAASTGLVEQIMEADREPNALPAIFTQLGQIAPENVVLHCLARACITSLLIIPGEHKSRVAYSLNSFLHSQGQQAAYRAIKRDVELKQFLQKYGGIHREFEAYNDVLERIWKKTPFEKSVFIMMPYRPGIAFRTLTTAIREACCERGYSAIRVDDQDRQFYDRLWDNLVVNMVSCQNAVAVYVSEQIVDLLDHKEPKMFANPNVALEFGFFKSRGQRILLLKDIHSPLPSDLQGFLWNSFDIDDPREDVTKAVNAFFDQIEQEAQSDQDAA